MPVENNGRYLGANCSSLYLNKQKENKGTANLTQYSAQTITLILHGHVLLLLYDPIK